MSVPSGYSDGMPIGLMFTSDHWNEDYLLSMAMEWEKSFDMIKPEVKV